MEPLAQDLMDSMAAKSAHTKFGCFGAIAKAKLAEHGIEILL